MPGSFRKYQKCPGRSDKAWSWHIPARFIKITYRKETYRHGSSPKRHKQQTINWVLFWVMFQTNTSRSLQNVTGRHKRTQKMGNRRKVAITMVRRGCDCEWYEAVTIPCWSERVIQTAPRFHLETEWCFARPSVMLTEPMTIYPWDRWRITTLTTFWHNN